MADLRADISAGVVIISNPRHLFSCRGRVERGQHLSAICGKGIKQDYKHMHTVTVTHINAQPSLTESEDINACFPQIITLHLIFFYLISATSLR